MSFIAASLVALALSAGPEAQPVPLAPIAPAPAAAPAKAAPATTPATTATTTTAREVTGSLNVDADVFDAKGEPGVSFTAGGLFAHRLRGKHVTWTLYVKRKLGAWPTARNYPLGDAYVAAQLQELPAVSTTLLYATLAKDRFLPGEHEAAIVGTIDDGKTEVFRSEAPFVLKATSFKPLTR